MSAKTSKVTETSQTGKTSRTSKTPKTSQVSEVSQVPQVKTEINEVWVLSVFHSPYKNDFTLKHRCYASEKDARKAMKEQAMKLYMKPIIQEETSKYFKEYESEIHYGESPGESDYRREFGFCRVECLQIQK
ncbi:40336_t:CDS:2 [Gigaspora margarita]|uniref:40336_t:CDS:1 n=1 Tax=Gigaspora margarita TaxID=4874 RepID=A0ABN7UIX4_GIGMA|nr:40336_t:CDS:2 [Gigaspora margarita]